MTDYIMIIDGEEVHIEVRHSARRSMGLEILQDGRIIARAPNRIADSRVRAFLEEHKEWIRQKSVMVELKRSERRSTGAPVYETLTAREKDMIRTKLTFCVEYYSKVMGVSYGRISIRNQKTRWGSCSSKGNLNFNCLLMLAPSEILDYVVVHELCHRKQMNHSKAFWLEVEKVLPDYKESIEWLKEEGCQLMYLVTGR